MNTESQNQTQSDDNWERIKKDAIQLINTLGNAIDQTASEISKLTIVSLEEEDRNKLDRIVEAGVVENRSAAVRYLIREGAKAKSDLFAQIEKTQAEIKLLHNNIRTAFASKHVD